MDTRAFSTSFSSLSLVLSLSLVSLSLSLSEGPGFTDRSEARARLIMSCSAPPIPRSRCRKTMWIASVALTLLMDHRQIDNSFSLQTETCLSVEYIMIRIYLLLKGYLVTQYNSLVNTQQCKTTPVDELQDQPQLLQTSCTTTPKRTLYRNNIPVV